MEIMMRPDGAELRKAAWRPGWRLTAPGRDVMTNKSNTAIAAEFFTLACIYGIFIRACDSVREPPAIRQNMATGWNCIGLKATVRA
jgi:hypothetical protein